MWQIGWVGIIARHLCVVSVMLMVEGGREGGGVGRAWELVAIGS